MAVISMFFGVIISMYYFDNRRHHLPHIHVKYQEHEAVFSISDGALLEGNVPSKHMKLILAWIEIHKDELIADWQLASQGENVFKIEPLR